MKTLMENQKSLSVFLRFLRVVIVLAVAAGLAGLLVSLKKEPEKKEVTLTPPSVRVIAATPVSKTMTVEAYGTVKPRKVVKITVEIPGRIDYLHPCFIEGGSIGQGELLVGIDQRSYLLEKQAGEVRVRQATADIQSLKQDIENLRNDLALSRANADLSEKEFSRIKALNQSQFASKANLDKAEQQSLQARIQLQNISNRLALADKQMEQRNAVLAMARVELGRAELAFGKTRILSDFDGFVLDKFAEKGEYVNPGQVIGSMYEKDRLDVDVSIPLEKMEWIQAFFSDGQTPEAKIVMANFDSNMSYEWDAKVARVKAKIDEKTRTLPMTLEIIPLDEKRKDVFELMPGTFVKCSILGETYENIIVLPRYLLKPDNILFTVEKNHLKMKSVNVLRKFEEEVYINGGLDPGDNIISSPLPGALEGMELTIKQNGN